MRRTARFVVAVLVIVAFPRPATAQAVDGLPGRETRRSAEWTQIEFTDPRWGVRTAYIRTDALSPSGTVVNTPAADDTAGLTARPPSRRPAPDPHDPYITFSLDEAPRAYEKMRAGHLDGRAVISPNGAS